MKAMLGHKDVVKSDPPEPFDSNDALFGRLLNLFSKKLPLQIKELKKALENNDTSLVEELGHTIKGGSALIAAHSLRDCAYKIEIAGKNGNLIQVQILIKKLEREYQKFLSSPCY